MFPLLYWAQGDLCLSVEQAAPCSSKKSKYTCIGKIGEASSLLPVPSQHFCSVPGQFRKGKIGRAPPPLLFVWRICACLGVCWKRSLREPELTVVATRATAPRVLQYLPLDEYHRPSPRAGWQGEAASSRYYLSRAELLSCCRLTAQPSLPASLLFQD